MDEKTFYRKQFEWLTGYQEAPPGLVRRFLKRLDVSRMSAATDLIGGGVRILDLGCSTGELLLLVGDCFQHLYGVDLAEASLSVLRRKLRERWNGHKEALVVAGNLNDGLSFRDESFDFVTAIAILEHVFDVYGLLEECRRVLKPGGSLVIEVPNIAYAKHRVRLLLGKLPVTSCPYGWRDGFGWDGGHLHYFTLNALRQILRESGFTIVCERSSGGILGHLRNAWVSLLAGNLLVKATKVRAPERGSL